MRPIRTLPLFFVVLLFLSACSSGPSIVGKWTPEDLSDIPEGERPNQVEVEFKSDGTLIQTTNGVSSESHWEWVEEGKKFSIKTPDGGGGTIEVDELTDEKMSYHLQEEPMRKITLIRM